MIEDREKLRSLYLLENNENNYLSDDHIAALIYCHCCFPPKLWVLHSQSSLIEEPFRSSSFIVDPQSLEFEEIEPIFSPLNSRQCEYCFTMFTTIYDEMGCTPSCNAGIYLRKIQENTI